MNLTKPVQVDPSRIGGAGFSQEVIQAKRLEELMDQLSASDTIMRLARLYPFCRITLQIQDGQVVHTDLNLSHKPNHK
ncbi:MAG: hypothetical protein HZB51_19905 [Chloroflexi bacterium]|nr:hypothetical protein [Chloroflexota bacterium]